MSTIKSYSVFHFKRLVSCLLCVCIVSDFSVSTRPSVLSLGMYQRLDKLRKNAFASVALFGADEDSSISGIWVFRGHELAFTVSIERFHTLTDSGDEVLSENWLRSILCVLAANKYFDVH